MSPLFRGRKHALKPSFFYFLNEYLAIFWTMSRATRPSLHIFPGPPQYKIPSLLSCCIYSQVGRKDVSPRGSSSRVPIANGRAD
jgi:hypothetical protein